MKTTLYILLGALFTFTSCVKYDAEPFTGKTLPRVSGYSTGVTNDWIYFNLRTGEVFNSYQPGSDIKEGEQRNRLDWDLAFCGYWKSHTNLTHPGKYFRPSKVKIMRSTSPK